MNSKELIEKLEEQGIIISRNRLMQFTGGAKTKKGERVYSYKPVLVQTDYLKKENGNYHFFKSAVKKIVKYYEKKSKTSGRVK